MVMLVGANKHFWRRCWGRHRVKYIDKVVNKIEIGIRLLNRLTWLCFLVFVDMKTGQCMTGFDLPQNFHSNPESLLRRMRARLVSTSEITLGSRTSHRIVVSFSSYGPEDTP